MEKVIHGEYCLEIEAATPVNNLHEPLLLLIEMSCRCWRNIGATNEVMVEVGISIKIFEIDGRF